ncbi:UNVERIFIED_CONTAM: hypothetical protein HDU68_006284 [Siphonaria sp. JEL0065]|nr:hypothetical protein HDU68_006284 [Siphonaria sp. JEL0065]
MSDPVKSRRTITSTEPHSISESGVSTGTSALSVSATKTSDASITTISSTAPPSLTSTSHTPILSTIASKTTTTTSGSETSPIISEKTIPVAAIGGTFGVALLFFLVWLATVRTMNYFRNKRLSKEVRADGEVELGGGRGEGLVATQGGLGQRSAASGSKVYGPGEYGRQFIPATANEGEEVELQKKVDGYERIV